MASESIAIQPLASWAIDSEPIQARGISVKMIYIFIYGAIMPINYLAL